MMPNLMGVWGACVGGEGGGGCDLPKKEQALWQEGSGGGGAGLDMIGMGAGGGGGGGGGLKRRQAPL